MDDGRSVVTEAPDIGRGESRPAPRELAWPIAAAGLLAVLSAYQLGARSLWRDEVASVVFASSPLPRLVASLAATEANQTVYYLLLHVWLKGGEDEAWIRLLSLVFGVATVLPIYLIGRRIGGHWAGSLAAFVFAGSRFVIQYDQEARGYSLAMLAAATLTWLLLRAMDRPTSGRWAAYGLLAAVSLYIHFFIAFVVAAHLVFLAASRSWPRGRALVGAWAPILLAAVPLPVIILFQSRVIDWIPSITLRGIASNFADVAGGQVLLVVMIELAGLAVLIHGRQRPIWLVVAWLVVPPTAAVLISLWKPLLVSKFLAVSVPAMAVLAGVALAGIRPRGAMVGSVIGVGLLVLIALPQVYERPYEDWRSAAQWIAAASRPGDRIVFQPPLGDRFGDLAIRYYLRRTGLVTPPEQVEIAEAAGDARGPVWVVILGDDPAGVARIRTQFQQRYTVVDERSVGGIRLIRVALFRPAG